MTNDLISRQAAIEEFQTDGSCFVYGRDACKAIISRIKKLPSVDAVPVCLCKDCLRFERNHWETVNGIPLIVGHNVCNGWGGGCQTDPEGYCFMAERKEDE